MDTMATANAKGVLNNEDFSKLVKQHTQQQIDGGASLKVDLESQKAALNPSLEDAAVQAVKDGKGVKAVKTDGDGNTHSIDVGPNPLLAFGISGQDAGADAGGGSTTFNVSTAETQKVTAFKNVFRDPGSTSTDTPPILANGQFQITNPFIKDIQKIVNDSLAANPDTGLQAIWDPIKNDPDSLDQAAKTKLIKDYINQNNLTEKHPNIVKLFNSSNNDQTTIQKLYHDFWTPPTVQPTPKVTDPTFSKLQYASNYESDKCGSSVALLARKFVIKTTGQDKNIKPLDLVIPGRLDPPTLPAGSDLSQVMKHTSVSALSSAIDASKQSIDTYKRLVVTGVHNGLNRAGANNTNPSLAQSNPEPEHYILIFGYQDNRFLFWDSDNTRSNIDDTTLGWGESFGVLFFRGGHPTTAFSDVDLTSLSTDAGHEGDHDMVHWRHK
ncbi:hypothetical protein GP486_004134 [Trichoglossum hirsutum]|uniref:Uncharacterized protein n=1 Tax=Trichoglossum hirsutum TaxID=265104 RepID=A0A9P8LBY8_9PEZI|nr:hypothetical protein GP486_004134 [Trichoglossum hirsutum]